MEPIPQWQESVDTGELVWIDAFDPEAKSVAGGHEGPKAVVKVVSYNILAEAYASEDLFPRTAFRHLLYSSRAPRIMERLSSCGADIICLQELDRWDDLWHPKMQELGYDSFYVQRPHKEDGCGIFWKTDKLKCKKTDWVSFEDGSLRIGAMAMFSFKNPPYGKKKDNTFVIGTTHLYWDHRHQAVQKNELKIFLEAVRTFNSKNLPTIITGDMNSSPGSSVHSLMLSGDDGGFPYRFKHVYRNYMNQGKEPEYSSFKSVDSNYWIDYVWYWNPNQEQRPWITQQVLAIPSVAGLTKEGYGLPDSRFPSDHLPIGGAIAFY